MTNPKQPQLLAHIPGELGIAETGGAQMVRVCDGSTLPRADKSKVCLLRTFGNSAHDIWDVTNPAAPSHLAMIVGGLGGTHKNRPEGNRVFFGTAPTSAAIAYDIPAVTDKTDKHCVGTGANERCKVAIQTNNVDVDDRGYIDTADRADTGLHILELTGEARTFANW